MLDATDENDFENNNIIIIIFNLITRQQSDNEVESQAWSMHVTMMHMLGGKEMFLVWI